MPKTQQQIAKSALRQIAKRDASRGTVSTRKTRHPITGCRAYSLMGIWLMDAAVLDTLRQQALSYDLKQLAEWNAQQDATATSQLPYALQDGTAVIDISGPITKYPTSFSMMMGGTATTVVEKQIAHAIANPEVKDIMYRIDTPGGTVDGSFDLAEVIHRAGSMKPSYAHADDTCTSAGYLLASQCSKVTANATARVGSIGVASAMIDTSKKFEAEKIKVHPLVTGKFKQAGMPGVAITDEQLAHAQSVVDDLYAVFVQKVSAGRGLSGEKIDALQAGVFVAAKAKEKGLIDGIMLFDDAMKQVQKDRTVTVPARGPAVTDKPETAPTTRSAAMPFTAQQLEQARKLPGAENITEAGAEQRILDIATSLSTENTTLRSQVPKQIDESLKTGKLSLAAQQLDFLGKQGVILPPQLAAMKDKPTVMADGNVYLSMDTVQSVLEMNKPQSLTTVASGAQAAPRETPEGDKPKTVADVTDARKSELLSLAGLSAQ